VYPDISANVLTIAGVIRLGRKSGVLCSTSVDQPARSSLMAFRFIHEDSPRRRRLYAASMRTAAGIASSMLQEFIG
jgi:hypothetical protein